MNYYDDDYPNIEQGRETGRLVLTWVFLWIALVRIILSLFPHSFDFLG
jgi:hypothetical protein